MAMTIFGCRENANSAVLREWFSPLRRSAEVKALPEVSPFSLTAKDIRFGSPLETTLIAANVPPDSENE